MPSRVMMYRPRGRYGETENDDDDKLIINSPSVTKKSPRCVRDACRSEHNHHFPINNHNVEAGMRQTALDHRMPQRPLNQNIISRNEQPALDRRYYPSLDEIQLPLPQSRPEEVPQLQHDDLEIYHRHCAELQTYGSASSPPETVILSETASVTSQISFQSHEHEERKRADHNNNNNNNNNNDNATSSSCSSSYASSVSVVDHMADAGDWEGIILAASCFENPNALPKQQKQKQQVEQPSRRQIPSNNTNDIVVENMTFHNSNNRNYQYQNDINDDEEDGYVSDLTEDDRKVEHYVVNFQKEAKRSSKSDTDIPNIFSPRLDKESYIVHAANTSSSWDPSTTLKETPNQLVGDEEEDIETTKLEYSLEQLFLLPTSSPKKKAAPKKRNNMFTTMMGLRRGRIPP